MHKHTYIFHTNTGGFQVPYCYPSCLELLADSSTSPYFSQLPITSSFQLCTKQLIIESNMKSAYTQVTPAGPTITVWSFTQESVLRLLQCDRPHDADCRICRSSTSPQHIFTNRVIENITPRRDLEFGIDVSNKTSSV
jgi:hypothetical protein